MFQLFVTNMRTIAHTQLLRGADYDYKKGTGHLVLIFIGISLLLRILNK